MILILAASNGKNLRLANAFSEVLLESETEHQVLDLTALGLPLFTPRQEDAGFPDGLDELRDRFKTADGFIFCSPEYNGSTPPSVTNLIAWLSRGTDDFRAVFNGKPAALATHSGGLGQKMLVALRLQLSHMGVNVIGREIQTNDKKPYRLDSLRSVARQLLT